MGDDQQYGAKPVVTVDGRPLEGELADQLLEEVVVDDHLHLPDMFALRFRDPGRDVLKQAGVDIGALVEISATPAGDGSQTPLIVGEVTAFEGEFDRTGSHVVVRGYDLSHRLCRGRNTRTFQHVTDADIARQLASDAGLRIGRIDATQTTYEHVSQWNVADWEFLKARAAETGHEVAVVLGRFEWRRLAEAGEAPGEGDLTSADPLQLTIGGNLEWFRPRVTAAQQVGEVRVNGWDYRAKRTVEGRATAGTTSVDIGIKAGELASVFGTATHTEVDRALATTAEAQAAADSLMEAISSAHCEADGRARGNPGLTAGASVSVGLAGWPWDGKYVLTATRHVYDHDGYRTEFHVSGRQERSLLGLVSKGVGGAQAGAGGARVYGVVVALVTNNNDPEGLGRVRLKFPWLADDFESWWARVPQPGAGKDRGLLFLPEVGDEVLVAFQSGDIRLPYVIGQLYNGEDKPSVGGHLDATDGKVKRRSIRSRDAHRIELSDDPSKAGVEISTGDDGYRISLDQTGTTITVSSKGDVRIEGSRSVAVTAGADLKLEATGALDIKGNGVTIDGGPQVAVSGGVIRLN
jgi:phage protein D/phage baseplate assembly protein gpV